MGGFIDLHLRLGNFPSKSNQTAKKLQILKLSKKNSSKRLI